MSNKYVNKPKDLELGDLTGNIRFRISKFTQKMVLQVEFLSYDDDPEVKTSTQYFYSWRDAKFADLEINFV